MKKFFILGVSLFLILVDTGCSQKVDFINEATQDIDFLPIDQELGSTPLVEDSCSNWLNLPYYKSKSRLVFNTDLIFFLNCHSLEETELVGYDLRNESEVFKIKMPYAHDIKASSKSQEIILLEKPDKIKVLDFSGRLLRSIHLPISIIDLLETDYGFLIYGYSKANQNSSKPALFKYLLNDSSLTRLSNGADLWSSSELNRTNNSMISTGDNKVLLNPPGTNFLYEIDESNGEIRNSALIKTKNTSSIPKIHNRDSKTFLIDGFVLQLTTTKEYQVLNVFFKGVFKNIIMSKSNSQFKLSMTNIEGGLYSFGKRLIKIEEHSENSNLFRLKFLKNKKYLNEKNNHLLTSSTNN